jgi:hypothetical protein
MNQKKTEILDRLFRENHITMEELIELVKEIDTVSVQFVPSTLTLPYTTAPVFPDYPTTTFGPGTFFTTSTTPSEFSEN